MLIEMVFMFCRFYFTYKIAKDFFDYMHFYQKGSLELFGSLIIGFIAFQLVFMFDYLMHVFFKTPAIGILINILSKTLLFML